MFLTIYFAFSSWWLSSAVVKGINIVGLLAAKISAMLEPPDLAMIKWAFLNCIKISSKKDFTSEFILFLSYNFLTLMISSSLTWWKTFNFFFSSIGREHNIGGILSEKKL